ncbi:MAG: hypothetical protein E6P95_00765 [Candidatus Moraniibacteriota bacterium]|nr:MAG: hypothetical protein E6P95_00765 [Candidatus Moranbacteria bacterium]
MLVSRIIIPLTFLTPLFFWTLTPSMTATPKEFLLIVSVLVIAVTIIYRLLSKHSISIVYSSLSLPLGLFTLMIIGTIIANPEGRPEALASKGLAFLALAFLAFVISSIRTTSNLTTKITSAILASTTLLSLHALLSLAFLSRSAHLPTYMQDITFTPTGSYLTTLILLLVGLTFAIQELRNSSTFIKNLSAALLIIHTVAIVAIISLMFPGGSLYPSLISYQSSWSIALDALKSLRSLLFGIGLSNFSLLYTSVKPLSINLSPLWNALPTTATSELLTLLPTTGILPTFSFLFLIVRGLTWTRGTQLALPFILLSLAFLTLPITLPVYLLIFLFLALSAPPRHDTPAHLSITQSRLLAGLILVFSLFILVNSARSYASEYLIKNAQNALKAENSQKVYDLHLQAIRLSPSISNYHLSFAEINFRLASALSQKQDLTDKDRETISKLVQQSISSSKTAISLRPNSATNWAALGSIYQNLINIAEGSDKFALEAFTRAISLDRANPSLRVEYASLLTQLASTQKNASDKANLISNAKNEFQIAIQLKADYANGYYNLAKLYESEADYSSAVAAMQQVVNYLDNTTTEHAKAVSELETLKSKLPSTPSPTPTQPSDSTQDAERELSEPSPLPSPLPGGPIEVK